MRICYRISSIKFDFLFMFTVCLSVSRHPSKVSHLFYFTLLSVIIAFLDLLTFSLSHVVSHNSYIDTLVIHVIFFLCKLSCSWGVAASHNSLFDKILFAASYPLSSISNNQPRVYINSLFFCVFSLTPPLPLLIILSGYPCTMLCVPQATYFAQIFFCLHL